MGCLGRGAFGCCMSMLWLRGVGGLGGINVSFLPLCVKKQYADEIQGRLISFGRISWVGVKLRGILNAG